MLSIQAKNVNNIELHNPSKYISSYLLNESCDSILIKNKYLPVYKYLNLDNSQIKIFDSVINDFNLSLQKFNEQKENGVKEFKNHLHYQLSMSKMILEQEQYKKYLRMINVTLANKKLMKYIVEDDVENID